MAASKAINYLIKNGSVVIDRFFHYTSLKIRVASGAFPYGLVAPTFFATWGATRSAGRKLPLGGYPLGGEPPWLPKTTGFPGLRRMKPIIRSLPKYFVIFFVCNADTKQRFLCPLRITFRRRSRWKWGPIFGEVLRSGSKLPCVRFAPPSNLSGKKNGIREVRTGGAR